MAKDNSFAFLGRLPVALKSTRPLMADIALHFLIWQQRPYGKVSGGIKIL